MYMDFLPEIATDHTIFYSVVSGAALGYGLQYSEYADPILFGIDRKSDSAFYTNAAGVDFMAVYHFGSRQVVG